MWSAEHPDYIIHYVTNSKSEIFTINELNEKVYHIIWDVSFWELFVKFIYIVDESNFSPVLDINILLENNGYILSLFFHYLSRRYDYYQEFSEILNQNAKDFGYRILMDNFHGNEHEKQNYEFPTLLCKQFVFWHEVAHAEFHKFDEENSLYQKYVNLIYSILDELPDSVFCEEMYYMKEIRQKIETRTVSQDLIEELAADLRAIQRMMNFKSLTGIKNNLFMMLSSIVSLIDFTMIKSIVDKRWDYHVKKKAGKPPILVEHQIMRKILFPFVVFIRLGAKELGESFVYDIKEQRDNRELFLKTLDIIMDEWYIKYLLREWNCNIVLPDMEKIAILNNVYSHMTNISLDASSKRLKYLFNIAHSAQHGDNSLESISLFYKYIDMALKKENENKVYIADAYSRIARVYAENGQSARAEILLNNAVDIAKKISKKDISLAFLFNNIGNVFLLLKNIDMAIKYYLKSLNLRIKFNDLCSMNIATVYQNLGECFYIQQKFPQALKYYFRAYRILKFRCDRDSITLIRIREKLKLFTDFTLNVVMMDILDKSFSTEIIKELKNSKYGTSSFKEYLYEMIRALLTMQFDEGCDYYIEIVELIEANINYPGLDKFFWYAFANIQNALRTELKIVT